MSDLPNLIIKEEPVEHQTHEHTEKSAIRSPVNAATAPTTMDNETENMKPATSSGTEQQHEQVTDVRDSSPQKRKGSIEDKTTPKFKRSRKLQGAGVKKPLYTRYESLFIVKAFKAITDKHPNLVLTDVFKIVSVLFKDEAARQGFKERTPDQLYQKYKRIQHGLNHGETEFLEFFRQNQYNTKEWIPDFSSVKDISIIDRITFPRLDEAVNEVKWSSNSGGFTMKIEQSEDQTNNENSEEDEDPDDELLTLAGYTDSNSEEHSGSSTIDFLKHKLTLLEEKLRYQEREISILRNETAHKDQEIEFLKNMVKEELSYIRHKLKDAQNA